MSEASLTLWKDGAFRADDFTGVAAGEPPPAGRPALLPLAAFLADPQAFPADAAPLGVLVAPGEDVTPLVPHLPRLALVALSFPSFADGRNYSTARLLRERHAYRGELRAVGEVLIDQIPLMRRCGIDSFVVRHEPTRRALAAGHLPEVRHYYQPTGASREVPAGTRPWTRRPAA